MGLVPKNGDDPVSASGGAGVDSAAAPTSGGSGIAGFGFFQIDLDLAYGVGPSDLTIRDANTGALAVRFDDAGASVPALTPGPLMLGVMVSTPELLPRGLCKGPDCFEGGLGLYGSFKGFVGGDTTTLAGSGGARFDYRFTEGVSMHVGGGGGFANLLTGNYQQVDLLPEGATGLTCGDNCAFNLSGPLAEIIAGISFGDRVWSFGLRTGALFIFPAGDGFLLSSAPAGTANSTESTNFMLINLGGHLGIVL
jgi:hypothetical protein